MTRDKLPLCRLYQHTWLPLKQGPYRSKIFHYYKIIILASRCQSLHKANIKTHSKKKTPTYIKNLQTTYSIQRCFSPKRSLPIYAHWSTIPQSSNNTSGYLLNFTWRNPDSVARIPSTWPMLFLSRYASAAVSNEKRGPRLCLLFKPLSGCKR